MASTKKSTASKKAEKTTRKTNSNTKKNKTETIMSQKTEQFDKFTREAMNANKEQTDAFIKSSTLFMKGFEEIAKVYMGLAQQTAQKNTKALTSVMGCKTLNEFSETQNKWAQQNFDDLLAGTTKISELSVKVVTEAFEPINNQLSKSIKKASESMAA